MTATNNGPGTTTASESDSEKIDRIASFVRDQRTAESSWTSWFGKVTVYIGLAAFIFGIGTFSDLRHWITSPGPSQAQLARDHFVSTLDIYCTDYVGKPTTTKGGSGFARIATDDLAVLTARNRMNRAWNALEIPAQMAPRDVGAFESIRSYFFAASDLLQAAVGRAKASDIDGYALDIGLYRQTNAAFVKAASDYGFTHCDYYWAVDDVPQPTS